MSNTFNRLKEAQESVFAITTRRPVAITMVSIALILFGYMASNKLPLNLMPDLSYPTITIRTEYPGSAPEEVENSISKPIEQLLGVVNNLESISSISKAGQSDIILEFSWDADIDQAILDVREQLDRFFFEDAERPLILRYDPTLDPIMRFAIYRTDSLNNPFYRSTDDFLTRTRRYADEEVKRKLEVVNGVAAVKIKGGLEEEIRVRISEAKLNLLKLNIRDITQRLSNENVNVAGGNIKEGQTEYIVRTLNEFESLDEIQDIIIGYRNETTPIYLRDISDVVRTHKDREIITRYGSRESVEIEIYKEADANIVDVANSVRHKIFGSDEQVAFVANMKPGASVNRQSQEMTDFLSYQLGEEKLGVSALSDQSIFIKSSIDEVISTALWGGVFAIIILFFFLQDLKSTIIVGIVIPISVFITFWPMDLFGVSLNLMSLGGLALGIGMLVDNAIVVLESIYRCREEGDDYLDSVVRGTKEVGSAVVASTLTTVAVFFPIVFVQGVAGQIFGDMALTVVFSLMASLVAAMFLIPMLASRQLKTDILAKFRSGFFTDMKRFNVIESYKGFNFFKWSRIQLFVFPFTLIYVAFKALLHTFAEIVGKIILLIFFAISAVIKFIRIVLNDFIIPFLLKTIVRFFTASIDYLQNIYPKIIGYTLDNRLNAITLIVIPTVFCVFFILPRLGSELIPEVHQGEFNLEVAYQIGTPVEQTAANIEEIEELVKNIPGVRSVSSRSGVDKTATTKSEEGEHTAKITITLDPVPDMKDKELEVIENVRNIVKNISGVVTKITRNEMFSFKTPIEVFIKGFELNKLKEYAERAMSEISKVKGIVDLKTNLKQGNPEIHITYDREKIAKYGLNLFQIANLVKNKVLGDVSTKYRDRDRRIDITVLLKEDDKKSIDHLKRLIVNPDQQIPITLASISNIEVAEGPSEIRREDQERTAIITANINGERDLKSIIEEIDQKMADMHFSSDFFYELAGQNKEMETSINSLVGALLLAVFLVYIIMASQFESFVHPFVILFSIPLALIGVFFALYVTNISLSIMTYLGMIMLAGIVVNNAIVLISHINLLRQDGMEKREAIIEGGRVRLRPILMTTATTVLGLLPMALGLGDGAEMRQPMAITVISGLVSSTVLTLIIIPTLYAIFDRTEMKKQDATETEQLGDEFVSPFKA